ncbi:hypothetical protein FACHB389_03285 [Nostoc calcicola FACHB-389]|nr:hypothetical protein FACHB389_03285 [Nostoc calcicola FACHB-389]
MQFIGIIVQKNIATTNKYNQKPTLSHSEQNQTCFIYCQNLTTLSSPIFIVQIDERISNICTLARE